MANNEAGSTAASNPRVFEITDLGLTYKRSQQNLLVWVTSLKAGTPVAGAQVIGFTKDMEVFPLGKTNADGVLICERRNLSGLSLKNPKHLTPVKRAVDQSDLVLLVAGTKDDVAFIQVLPQGNLKPQGIWQGKVGEKLRTLQGNIFTERGVYRPGEKVFYKGAVREYDQGRIFPPTKARSAPLSSSAPRASRSLPRKTAPRSSAPWPEKSSPRVTGPWEPTPST